VPTNYVSKILGHTNLTTTSRYLNINVRGLHIALDKLEEYRAAKKAVAQPLHNGENAAPADVPDADTAPGEKSW